MIDCRTCKHFTRKGCMGVVQCIDASTYVTAKAIVFYTSHQVTKD